MLSIRVITRYSNNTTIQAVTPTSEVCRTMQAWLSLSCKFASSHSVYLSQNIEAEPSQ